MRDYAKVGPQFWIGKTGKRLRKAGSRAQVVALYLVSGPHANMLGLYYLTLASIAGETGLGEEGARLGLADCVEAGFCSYDEDSEMVWVHEMASYQIAEKLEVRDLRCKGVQNEYNSLLDNPFLPGFYDKYATAFHMTAKREMGERRGNAGGDTREAKSAAKEAAFFEAAGKALPSQEQEQEHDHDHDHDQEHRQEEESAQPAKRSAQGARLPEDWALPRAWGEWALAQQPSWNAEHVRLVADKFRDYWLGKSGRDARKADWQATWRNWVRNEKSLMQGMQSVAGRGSNAPAVQRAADNEEARRLLFGAQAEAALDMGAVSMEASDA